MISCLTLNFSVLVIVSAVTPFPSQGYTCPMHCMLRELDLVYEEDGWPSIPKMTEFFADSPMNPDQIGKW